MILYDTMILKSLFNPSFSSTLQEDGMNMDDQAQVTTEMANRMSLFYAYPTPMLKTLSDATSKFVSEVIHNEEIY